MRSTLGGFLLFANMEGVASERLNAMGEGISLFLPCVLGESGSEPSTLFVVCSLLRAVTSRGMVGREKTRVGRSGSFAYSFPVDPESY